MDHCAPLQVGCQQCDAHLADAHRQRGVPRAMGPLPLGVRRGSEGLGQAAAFWRGDAHGAAASPV